MKRFLNILIMILVLCSPIYSEAYETKGGESYIEFIARKQAIESHSKKLAKYIYKRIEFYQSFNNYYDRATAGVVMYEGIKEWENEQ